MYDVTKILQLSVTKAAICNVTLVMDMNNVFAKPYFMVKYYNINEDLICEGLTEKSN